MPSPRATTDGLRGRARLAVFVDADCGLCTQTARVLRRIDGGGRLDLRPLESAVEVPGSPPLLTLREVLHVRDASGRWWAGGQAVVRLSRELWPLRPIALAARLPGVARLVEPAYGLVARNRHRISGWLGLTACRIVPARR